ncbi:NUDIX hydrolase [Rhizobium sp. BR 317]|uniref:NUDIX hydrolase n=1 Tax=Rhizobium sp. BR 317 TaxID=3040015 RepID=UPI0039BFF071
MTIELVRSWTRNDHLELATPARQIAQAGAICLRPRGEFGETEVLLISSRSHGGWGIPKRHIEPGETSFEAAQREAFEEAGVIGEVTKQRIGSFSYHKDKEGRLLRYAVAVHLLSVHDTAIDYPEKNSREVKWVPITTAGPELAYSGLREVFDKVISPVCP